MGWVVVEVVGSAETQVAYGREIGENVGMKEMSGKQLNLSVYSKRGKVIRMRPYGGDGKPLETAGKLYSAELRSLETDERVSGVSVSYTKEGDVLLGFPAMGVGQYVLVVDVSVESGTAQNFMTGYVTYMEPAALVKPERESVPERLLCVYQDGEGVRCEWWETSAAEIAAEEAQEAAAEAKEMREGIKAALDAAVEEATERSESAAERAEAAAERAEDAEEGAKESNTLAAELAADLRARLLKMIKVIDNYLYIDDVNTGQYLKGKDGLQVYISEDGHWYLSDGTYLGWPATGADGVTPHITAEGYWAFGEEVTEYRAIGRDGLDGTAVRRIIVDSYDDIPQEGETCNGGYYYYVPLEDGSWNVYAWLETPDGNGGWVFVGLANDIATAEVHGLVKLATDVTVTDGAPVGNNGSGQMSVPRSSVSSPGTGKLGTGNTLTTSNSGVVGMTASGQYMARKADNSHYGTVMYSRTDNMARIIGVGEVPSGTKVDGIERGGRLGATRADAHTYGMNKCSYTMTNAADFSDVVYVLPIGMRDDTKAGSLDSSITDANSDPWYYGANGHLAVRLKSGGALQWASTGQGERHGVSFSTGGHLWVRTNDSFSQSRENGLILNEATTSLLGGVRKMTTLGSGQDVPTGSAVLTYIGQQLANYYTKAQVYSKAESERIIDAECAERVPYYAAQTLAQYAKKTDVNSSVSGKADASTVSQLASTVSNNKTSVDNSIRDLVNQMNELKSAMSAYVKVGNSGIQELWLGTKTQFAGLQSLDENIFYIVLRG